MAVGLLDTNVEAATVKVRGIRYTHTHTETKTKTKTTRYAFETLTRT